MRFLLITFLFPFYIHSFGQTSQYQNLLDTALNGHGCLFVFSRPSKITRLDQKEMWYYVENIKEYSHKQLDTVMFSEIIQNTILGDTTLWADNELPGALLVNERNETLSKEYALKKFPDTNSKQINFYKKQVTKFNSTDPIYRNICYFSRPVFDNAKRFAIVEWNNGHGYLGGGGGIILYELQSDKTWKEFGIILNWRY